MSFAWLDEKDRRIISLLDEGATQGEIASEIGISQPSVNARIRNLKGTGVLEEVTGLNPFELGIPLVQVTMYAKRTRDVIEEMSACPFYAGSMITTGRRNLTIYLVGEDLATIESVAEFKLRDNPDVEDIELNQVVHSTLDTVFPVNLDVEVQEPTCGGPENYRCYDLEERYIGCPLEEDYEGDLWEPRKAESG